MFGYIDTTYVDLPGGLDAGYLQGLQTRSGLSVAEMIRAVDSAMSVINTGADPLVADLAYLTSNPVAGERGSGTKKVMRAGEYMMGRPQQIGPRTAHMLPLGKYEIDLGFTEDGLEEITQDAFNDELQGMVDAYRRFHLAETLNRMFSGAETPVDEKTSYLSPGFAGSGTGSNVFGGQYPDGTDVPGGYTHYAYTTPANLAATIATYLARLEKWHAPAFDMIASPAALADITALPLFVDAGSALVRLPSDQAEARVDATIYVGVLNGKIRVRQAVQALGSAKHIGIWKAYGPFNTLNPVAWRYDPLRGQGAIVRSRTIYPLADATSLQWAGFGVGNRTNGILIFVDTAPGAYVPPTISIA